MSIMAFLLTLPAVNSMLIMEMKAALFDLDGVIVNTEPLYTDFWQEVGKEYFPEDESFAKKLKGQTLNNILSTYFGSDEKIRQEIRKRLDAFESQMDFPLINGVESFLSQLKAAGIPAAVVTSSDRFKMQRLEKKCPKLMVGFDSVFTAEDALRSKPAPDCYISTAHALGFEPEDCCVFEDSVNGLRAARASGAFVVGLTTSFPEDVVGEMSDITVQDFSNMKISDINIKK